jgi:hypothetical protein
LRVSDPALANELSQASGIEPRLLRLGDGGDAPILAPCGCSG